MSGSKKSLVRGLVALLLSFVLNAHAEDNELPDLGARTADGFTVRCYWLGQYDRTLRFGGQGVLGVGGQLMAPLNGEQKTHVVFILTQEVDDHGKMRMTSRTAYWSSTVSNLHYWSRENQRPKAGPGGAGSGDISADDLTVKATESDGRVQINVGLDPPPGRYSFEVRYHRLELKNVLTVRVAAKEETERRDATMFGFSAEEPVKPNSRKLVIRREWGDPGAKSNWYEKWVVMRVCQKADVHLVEPRGTTKQYTFNGAQPGVLDVVFKAAATPGNANILQKMKDRVQFKIDGIGNSKMEWDAANPGGKAIVENGFLTAKLKFIGLPAKNDDLGKKTVELLVDGYPVETASVKVFFAKLATNHPGGTSEDPNWFYYWKEGGVCGIQPGDTYDGTDTKDLGYCLPWVDSNVRLCALGCLQGQGPLTFYASSAAFKSVTVSGHGKGIKCVAEVLEHERHHILIYKLRVQTDSDSDWVPDKLEGTLDRIKSDPNDPDTFQLQTLFGLASGYGKIGDNEVRCRKKELSLTVPYDPKKDWADPGCQSKEHPYGP
jgi:hypothetical protein